MVRERNCLLNLTGPLHAWLLLLRAAAILSAQTPAGNRSSLAPPLTEELQAVMDQGDSLSLEGTVQGKLNSLQFVTQCPYAQGKHEMD